MRIEFGLESETLVFPLSRRRFIRERGITYGNIAKREKYWLRELGGSGFAYMWDSRAFFFGLFPDSATRILKFVKVLKRRGYL